METPFLRMKLRRKAWLVLDLTRTPNIFGGRCGGSRLELMYVPTLPGQVLASGGWASAQISWMGQCENYENFRAPDRRVDPVYVKN